MSRNLAVAAHRARRALSALGLLLVCLALLPAAHADTVRFAWLGLADDVRYDEDETAYRTLSRAFGDSLPGARVALRESRFVGQAIGADFALTEVRVRDAAELTAQVDRLAAEGVRYFILDLPAEAVAALARHTRGRELLLINAGAADDALRQAQCQPHLLHTLPNHAMQADALVQFLVFRKWRKVMMLTGPLPDDRLQADAFRRAAKRFGLQLTDARDFVLSRDPRQRDQGNIALLTAGARDADVIYIADSDGAFARGAPYATVPPRPVVGSEGLAALGWHWGWTRHGAPQLSARLMREAKRHPASNDWAAWVGFKSVVEAVVRSQSTDFATVRDYLLGEDIIIDGFKGNRLSFRAWDRQLRQPMLLATHNAVIERAPVAGFLHPSQNMDTLGFDARESQCQP